MKQIKILQEIIRALADKRFSGKLEICFNSGGIASVVKTEKLSLEEAKYSD